MREKGEIRMKIITCSRCGCKKEVSEEYVTSGFKLCPDCIQKKRQKRQIEKDLRAEAGQIKIENELAKGNLNYGLETPKKFMTWQEYKAVWKEKANFQQYMKDKSAFSKEPVPLEQVQIPTTNLEGINLWSGNEQPTEEQKRKLRDDKLLTQILIHELFS
jgi:hypothetical protein